MNQSRFLTEHFEITRRFFLQAGVMGVAALNAAEQKLDTLDAAVGRLAIPNGYSNDQFGIRDDLDLVRTRVQRQRERLLKA